MSPFFSPRPAVASLVLFGAIVSVVQLAQANPERVGQVAQKVTVRIESGGERVGSGVIIAYQEGTYYVLSAAHVIRPVSATFTIVAHDGQEYAVPGSEVIKLRDANSNNIDMAILAFNAPSRLYELAEFGNPNNLVLGSQVYVSGWPSSFSADIGGQFVFSPGQVSILSSEQFQGGYELGYSSNTSGGMSGGPVLNSDGLLVAMHGAAEGQRITSDTGEQIEVKQGFNWGIPVTTFVALAPEAFIDNAQERMGRGDYDGAIADFSQGLFFNSTSANALVGRAFAKFAIGRDWNAVIDDASEALRYDSNNAQAYLVRGAAHVQLDRHNDAIEDLRRSIAGLDGGLRVVALSLQARSYAEQREVNAAITAATDAINTLSSHPFAYSSRASVRESFGDIEAASSDEAQAQILVGSYTASDPYEAAILSKYGLAIDTVISVDLVSPGTRKPPVIPDTNVQIGGLNSLFVADSSVESLAMSTGGNYIAAGSEVGTVYLHAQGSTRTLNGHSARVQSLSFSPDGNLLASGGVDGVIQLWNTATGQLQGTIEHGSGAVSGLTFSRSGSTLLAGGANGKVEQYTVSTRSLLRDYTDAILPLSDVAMSYGGQYMAASSGRVVLIWDVANGERFMRFNGSENVITGLEYLTDDSGLVVGDSYGNVAIWDLATQQQRQVFDTGWEVASLALSPDQRSIVVGAKRDSTGVGEVSFWDLTGNRTVPPTYFDQAIQTVLWSPDGRVFAGSKSGEVFVLPAN